MSSPTPVALGPFAGGLNNFSDPASIADAELAKCINFEIDTDGALISRPPVVTLTPAGSPFGTTRLVVIGTAYFSNTGYVILSNASGTWAFDGTTMTLIRTNLESYTAVQFMDKLWVFPIQGSVAVGCSWDPVGGMTSVAALPTAESAIVFRNRLWCVPGDNTTANTSRLKFSDPIAPSTWPGINNIDVADGDGQRLVDLHIYQDNLLLIKKGSIYVLAFDSTPSDAVLQVVSPKVGASNRWCAVEYEGVVYFLQNDDFYRLNDYQVEKLNRKVLFEKDVAGDGSRSPKTTVISAVGERIIIRYHNKVYSYSIRQNTFAEWSFVSSTLSNVGRWAKIPEFQAGLVNNIYYAGGLTAADANKIFRLTDAPTTDVETGGDITCTARSKNFSFAESHKFKKLAWWGADILSGLNNIIGRANVVTATYGVTWNQLHAYTWDQLLTWDNPLVAQPVIESVVDNSGPLQRIFIKFPKALRFRQINFEIVLVTNGSVTEGPCKVFGFTAIVGSKETTVKQVS